MIYLLMQQLLLCAICLGLGLLCGWLLCYPLYPRTSEREMD